MKVTIKEVEGEFDLYCHYRGQPEVQPCFIELDLSTGTLLADYDGEIGGMVSHAVHYRRVLRWAIPLMTSVMANDLLEKVAPLAQRILDGASIVWDGSNLRGILDGNALDAEAEIESLCSAAPADIEVWSAWEWLSAAEDELEITAETTDKELEEKAAVIEHAVFYENIVAIEYTLQYLRNVRNKRRDYDNA